MRFTVSNMRFLPGRVLRSVAAAFLALVAAGGFGASAEVPYDRLQVKADRFFSQHEWAQAAATYYQMLEARPDVPATYGKAIVANAVRGDTVAEMQLMVKALNSKVPFDSVLSRVKSTSFELGKSNLYGDFLLRVREAYPWMRRPIDNYLLRYYTYRMDGAKMMEYSRMMLQGAPGNRGFLMAYARGAMLCGRDDEGLRAYREILSGAPDDYDVLLALGNYYALPGSEDKVLAVEYLSRANEIHPTPYVTALLEKLNPPKKH